MAAWRIGPFAVSILCLGTLVALAGISTAQESYSYSTLVGGKGGFRDGTARDARLRTPEGIAVDRLGNVYITEYWNSTVRKISPEGRVTTIGGREGATGAVDGPAAQSVFNRPHGIAVDCELNVYVSDMKNHTIRKISPSGNVSTVAGLAGESGSEDGVGKAARFCQPEDVAVDGEGTLYVADTYNFTVRRIAKDGAVTTLAGKAGSRGAEDGIGSAARFSMPLGLDVDSRGVVYVADGDFDAKKTTGNCTIRRIAPDGKVATLAGRAGSPGSADGALPDARFTEPVGIAVARDGTLFVADTGAHTIRRISPDGRVTTVGGSFGKAGRDDGPGAEARFNAPQSIAVDLRGNLYIADTFSHTVRKGVPGPRRQHPVPAGRGSRTRSPRGGR